MEASRAVLAARYKSGETFQEVGASIGVSEGTARNLLSGLVEPRNGGWQVGRGRPRKPKPPLLAGRSWEVAVVAWLRELKAGGYAFKESWAMAEKAYPPRGRDAAVPDALFDENGDVQVSHRDFFREACRVAWHGERPGLERFSLDMLSPLDWSSDARIVGMAQRAS